MSRFHVTFKGGEFDITVSGDSAEEIVREYAKISAEIEKALGSAKGAPVQVGMRKKQASKPPVEVHQEKTLDDFEIPNEVRDNIVEQRNKLSNWDILFVLLHYAPYGISNKQIRALSEELGKPISYSWFDTSFHRRANEGLVVSRRPIGSRETLYFLAAPGKRKAIELIESFVKKSTP